VQYYLVQYYLTKCNLTKCALNKYHLVKYLDRIYQRFLGKENMSARTLSHSRKKPFYISLPWIGPAILMILLFVLWPAIDMISTSFKYVNEAGQIRGWTGISNYQTLFTNPDLPGVLIRTLIWVVGVVAVTVLISLPLAQMLHQKFPGRRLVRYCLIVPWAASVVMTAISWRWILDGYYGILNRILMDLGLISQPYQWLGSSSQAFIWLMLVAVFVSVPFTTYVIIAGLATVPHEILEAARVDGANDWKRYWQIVFPLLRPSLMIGIVINLINVFNSFPIIWAITEGGPGSSTDTTTTLAYKIAFKDADIGQSASLATINFLIILIFIGFFLKASRWNAGETK
jgi:multiple sugar transport system permease protein